MAISVVLAVAILVVALLCYAVYRYQQETERLRLLVAGHKEQFRKQDDYYRGKLAERSERDKEREKTLLDVINESNRLKDYYRDEPAVWRRNLTLPWWRRRRPIDPTIASELELTPSLRHELLLDAFGRHNRSSSVGPTVGTRSSGEPHYLRDYTRERDYPPPQRGAGAQIDRPGASTAARAGRRAYRREQQDQQLQQLSQPKDGGGGRGARGDKENPAGGPTAQQQQASKEQG